MLAFTNARIFNGRSDQLASGTVVVDGATITQVGAAPPPPGAEVIDCAGRVLMPGLIDAHIHAYFQDLNVHRLSVLPVTMYAHHASRMLGEMLNRGFTTVRDAGGGDWGLALAIEQGLVVGPRLYFCERALSPTGGHGDFRNPHHYLKGDDEVLGCGCRHSSPVSIVVDGVDSVRRVVREQLRRGASFIKFMGSGGVSSTADSLDSFQFSEDEVRAIVEETENHGVYCTAHVIADAPLKRAIRLGVHCIEHATLIEPDTARMAADAGTHIVPTCAVVAALAEHGAEHGYPATSLEKLARVKDEMLTRLCHLRTAGVTVGFGTDLIGPLHTLQCIEFELRSQVFSNFEILHQATAANARIIGAAGKLGEIAVGATADILLVDGNPLDDLSCFRNDGTGVALVMKGGAIHRSAIGPATARQAD